MLKVLQTCYDNRIKVIVKEQRTAKVKEGIRFILTHFQGRQPLFPRKMSTSLSQGRQFTIYSKEQILNECIKANFTDCRLSAYPVLSDDGVAVAASTQSPNIIFIDIDLPQELNHENSLKLNEILSTTLNLIKHNLHGCNPTVIWTGNGYHIYIVLDTRPLELITDLTELSREPSKEFLKFAELILTDRKADCKHNHSFNSYLLRIPHTFNSKCIGNDKCKDAEVRIIQKFDALNIPQNHTQLIRHFRLYLADLDIKKKTEIRQDKIRINLKHYPNTANTISYVEKLLGIQLEDHRKFTISLIIAPYFVNVQGLSYGDSFNKMKQWVLRCNEIRKLEPSIEFFDNLIDNSIKRTRNTGVKPLKFEDTLQRKNKKLYEVYFKK